MIYHKDHEERDRHTEELELDGVRIALAVFKRGRVIHMFQTLSDKAIEGACPAVEVDHRPYTDGSSDCKNRAHELSSIHTFPPSPQ